MEGRASGPPWRRLRGEQLPVEALARGPVSVPESTSVLDVLGALQEDAVGGAVVVDEHGGLAGMISRDEILRVIKGRVVSAIWGVDAPQMERREDGSTFADDLLPLVDLRESLGLRGPLPEESRYGTAGGFVMSRLQRIPETGDAFEAYGFRFEVLERDQRRVSRPRATPTGRPAEGEGDGSQGP